MDELRKEIKRLNTILVKSERDQQTLDSIISDRQFAITFMIHELTDNTEWEVINSLSIERKKILLETLIGELRDIRYRAINLARYAKKQISRGNKPWHNCSPDPIMAALQSFKVPVNFIILMKKKKEKYFLTKFFNTFKTQE